MRCAQKPFEKFLSGQWKHFFIDDMSPLVEILQVTALVFPILEKADRVSSSDRKLLLANTHVNPIVYCIFFSTNFVKCLFLVCITLGNISLLQPLHFILITWIPEAQSGCSDLVCLPLC